ncbi:MAG: polyprenyl synthetase family protein [Eubacteriales bacterium]|nr:polyprenyl synthetase family protein [Eubacteriales bacterium]
MTFNENLEKRRIHAEEIISQYLPKEDAVPGKLAEAMNYSMLAGGKRIRPILLEEAYHMLGGTGNCAEPFMAAIEMIHTSSLVHDDLPAIDNDLSRRGRPTTHAAYGHALGVLSGDALLNYAYETALKAFTMDVDSERVLQAVSVLAAKTGMYGMLGGQSVDVENEKNRIYSLDKESLDYIYLNKTAALLEAPLMVGAILAGADEEQIACMEQIGRSAGLAFQIEDDILDVTGTEEELGKPIGSDEKNDKTTYVTLMGIEQAKEEVFRLTEDAVARVRQLPGDGTFLEGFLRSLSVRTK